MNRWSLLVGALVLFLGSGCTTPAPAAQLTVLAASSLSGSLDDISAAWTRDHPETRLVTSVGSSAALRTQIEQGAPADVYLAADTTNPQALIDAGLGGRLIEFATNRLTVIVPADNPAGIATPADLAKPGVCVIAAGKDVPITKYASQLVGNLAARSEYGPDFATRYEANVCSREDNVGAVVNKVSLGEGDAAIVYVTDAIGSQNVKTIDLPADTNVVATYGAVPLANSDSGMTGSLFANWLGSDDAQAVLAAHGFGAAP